MFAEENFFELPVGTVCSMEYMSEFIKRLSKKQGEEMNIHQTSKEFSIYCSNEPRDTCPFHYLFAKKIDVESKEVGLELKKKHTQHSELCKVYNEDASYQRNRLLISESKPITVSIILSRYHQYGPQNPKKILEVVSEALGYNEIFITKGLQCQELKRKIKKKFDNLVADIRKEYNLTPTKLKNNRQIKKQKAKFRLFRQKSQSCENSQQNEAQIISEEEMNEDDDDENYNPCKNRKKRSDEKQQKMQDQLKQKEMVRQQSTTGDNSHSFRSSTECSFTVYGATGKRKIIKKEW